MRGQTYAVFWLCGKIPDNNNVLMFLPIVLHQIQSLPVHIHTLTCFVPTDEEEIRKAVMRSPSKSCELDPLPTSLTKENINVLAPYITNIVNKSSLAGIFPQSQKTAYVRPLIKKPTFWIKNLKNLQTHFQFKVSRRNNRGNFVKPDFRSYYCPLLIRSISISI